MRCGLMNIQLFSLCKLTLIVIVRRLDTAADINWLRKENASANICIFPNNGINAIQFAYATVSTE